MVYQSGYHRQWDGVPVWVPQAVDGVPVWVPQAVGWCISLGTIASGRGSV